MRNFASLAAFSAWFATRAAAMREAQKNGLTHGANVIAAAAKESIGHYQQAVGPFGEWPDLADATKTDRVALGFPENDPLLRTGEMRESIAVGDVSSNLRGGLRVEVGSTDKVMLWQELGTADARYPIPPRSVLGGAAVREGEKAANTVGQHVFAALTGRPPPNLTE